MESISQPLLFFFPARGGKSHLFAPVYPGVSFLLPRRIKYFTQKSLIAMNVMKLMKILCDFGSEMTMVA